MFDSRCVVLKCYCVTPLVTQNIEYCVASTIRYYGGETAKMDVSIEDEKWDAMTHGQKNHELFLRQKALLDQFYRR